MIKISTIRENCFSASYTRGKQLFDQNKIRNLESVRNDLDDREIHGEVKGSGGRWYQVTVTADGEDEIIDYTCECPAYDSYWGMCKHCVAVALADREKQKSSLENNPLIRKGFPAMKQMKKQETSSALKNAISRNAVRKNVYLLEYYHEIRLEPIFTTMYSRFSVEFKIGSRKLYVLKNVCKLLDDVNKGKYDSYGKNLGFIHDRAAFTQEALQWIDLLTDYMRTRYGDLDFETQSYGNNYRQIDLTSYALDKIFQMYMGRTLDIDGKEYIVEQGNPFISVSIKNVREEGAEITLNVPRWIQGTEYDYFMEDGHIWQCTQDFSENMMEVLKPLVLEERYHYYYRNKQPEIFYLNREDYTAFCGNILPVLEAYGNLENHVDFEGFLPQEAEINVYLSGDDKDENTVQVKAEAVYGVNSYNLFERPDPQSQYRDLQKEYAVLDRLEDYFLIEKGSGQEYAYCKDEDTLYKLIKQGLGEIQELANLFLDEKLRTVRLLPPPPVAIGVSIKDDLLNLDIQAGEMDYREMEQILAMYKRRKKYYRLKDGSFISLEDNGLSVVSELAEGLGFGSRAFALGKFQVPKYRASYISETLKEQEEKAESRRSQEFKRLVRDMNSYGDSDFEVPAQLHAQLRSYQKDGFRWLATLAQWGFGGILADDMGLGKTLQVITLLESAGENALVVCPASLVYNWESELHRFAPDLQVVLIVGSSDQRKKLIAEAGEKEILVTSYDLLKRDLENYEDKRFSYMIVDEAQYIKNAETQVAKAVKEIQAVHRFALTGTPIENRLSDLWSIFDFIMPGYLYTYRRFKEEIEIPVVQNEESKAVTRLKRMVNPFILRRKKGDVLKDLPDKLEKVIYVKMGEEQRRLYNARVQKIRLQLEGQTEEEYNSEKIRYLAELTALRQICCSPGLCYENYKGSSAKLDSCMEQLSDIIQGEHRVLLFSQFTTMLDMLAKELDKAGFSYLYLSGKTSKEQRRKMVQEFQSGGIQVFLISLKAGGTGLNLTQADVVIHYDPWWNAAAQNQATDRTHRIGQRKVVTEIKLVTKDTIEEKILELQRKKAQLAQNVMEGQAVADHRISREELMELIK